MKKTLFTLFTVINLVLLYCPAALALTEDEAAAAVDAQGKDAVSGNLFLWLLCAIAFLKVATKLDGILHSLGIGVSRSPGSMLSEALLAFRGFEIGKAFMLQKPPPQLLPQKPHPATPLQAGSPAW